MSHVDPASFAERLMKAEPADDQQRRRHEEDKLALTERRLTPRQRRMGWLGLSLYGLLVVGCGYRLLRAAHPEPRELVVLDAVAALGLLALGLWLLRVLLRGGRVMRRDDRAMEWIGGVCLCALSFAVMEVAGSLNDAHVSPRLYFLSAALLVGGAFSVLLERIRRAKLEARIELVELKLLVAELARALATSSDAPGPRR